MSYWVLKLNTVASKSERRGLEGVDLFYIKLYVVEATVCVKEDKYFIFPISNYMLKVTNLHLTYLSNIKGSLRLSRW